MRRGLGHKRKLARFHQKAATNDLAIDASVGDEFVVAAPIKAVKLILNGLKEIHLPRFS